MIKAVLLDLDETLIRNPNQGFVPLYLQLIDEFFMRRWGMRLSRTLIDSVRLMNSPRDLEHTNQYLAMQLIQQASSKSEEEITTALQEFYADFYPALQSCTQTVSGAPELIADLKAKGYSVVIATNPIYPPEAIRQRLQWAGLSGNFDDYDFVTRADNMHFAKPHPAYYAEILGRVGVEPDEAVMVGDSIANDIAPASSLGIHTCLTTPGDLSEFQAHTGELDQFIPQPLTPAAIIPQFEGNIGALFGLIDMMKPHYWNQHPDPDEWSPLQIVCHLLEREAPVHRQRLERILNENNPFIPDPGLPPGPHDAIPCDEDGYRAARRFLQERKVTIDLLKSLTEQDWQRPGRHSIFGPTTLLEMALFTAQHDRLHLKQLCQTTGKCS